PREGAVPFGACGMVATLTDEWAESFGVLLALSGARVPCVTAALLLLCAPATCVATNAESSRATIIRVVPPVKSSFLRSCMISFPLVLRVLAMRPTLYWRARDANTPPCANAWRRGAPQDNVG